MSDTFFQLSKSIIVGPKPSNRASIRKMFSSLGCDNRNIETCITIGESLEIINKSYFNVLIIDDDCKDIKDLDQLIESFKKRLKDSENCLVVFVFNDSNLSLFEKHFGTMNSIQIKKPYTIGSFNKEIEIFWMGQKDKQEKKHKVEQKNKKRMAKAKKAYVGFDNYINKTTVDSSEDTFLMLSKDFLSSLDKEIDYEALSKILAEGIVSRRFKDLDLFVEGWINSIPIESKFIPDISRVLLFNNHFDLFEKLKSKDQVARLAIGVGMVISASVICKDESNNEKVVKYIQTGVDLVEYKPVVVCSALEILLKINAIDEAWQILESSRVLLDDDLDLKLKESLEQIEEELYSYANSR